MEDLWKRFLDILALSLGKATYQIVQEGVFPLSVDNRCLNIGVHSDFMKSRMESDLLPVIEEAISRDLLPPGLNIDSVSIQVVSQDDVKTGNRDNPEISTTPVQPVYNPEPAGHSGANLNPKYTFDTFVVSSSNEFAYAGCLAVANNPGRQYNPLFIYGGVGLGKTHLMQAIAHYIMQENSSSRIRYVTSEQFTNDLISSIGEGKMQEFRKKYRTINVLLVDDIEFLAGKDRTQEEFFHTFNDLFHHNSQVVLCSDRPPGKIQNIEDRLVNRFEKGLIADIQTPDFELRVAILKRMAESTNLVLSKDVLRFMAENITNNIRDLEGAFINVMGRHSLLGKPIDIPMVEQAIKSLIRPGNRKVTVVHIQKEVSKFYKIKSDEMKSRKREQRIAFPRQIAMYLTRELTDLSLSMIGDAFGGKDHSTVMHSCAKIMELKEKDDRFRAELDELFGKFREE